MLSNQFQHPVVNCCCLLTVPSRAWRFSLFVLAFVRVTCGIGWWTAKCVVSGRTGESLGSRCR